MTTIIAVVLTFIISSFIQAYILRKQHQTERREDREDRNQVAIQFMNSSELTNEKLDTIHILVNSNMTAAMQAEKDATVRELAMMNEVIALNRSAGREPSKDALAAVKTTQEKISELSAQLEDRLRQTRIAELKGES